MKNHKEPEELGDNREEQKRKRHIPTEKITACLNLEVTARSLLSRVTQKVMEGMKENLDFQHPYSPAYETLQNSL